MLSKVFLGILAVSIGLVGFFSFYSWSWLQSIGAPLTAVEGYGYHSALAWKFLWATAIILMGLANAVLWKTARSWALWSTFAYFAFFIALRYFWIDRTFLSFQLENGMRDTGFSAAPLMAVILIAVMAAIVFFDMYLVTRLREKVYGTAADVSEKENSRSEMTES